MPQDLKLERDMVVEELARRADLPAIAEELGMRVLARGSRQPKALCPFHDDRTPSLVFYLAAARREDGFIASPAAPTAMRTVWL